MAHQLILAATITTPHLHWPNWLSGFGGGMIVGLIIGIWLDKTNKV